MLLPAMIEHIWRHTSDYVSAEGEAPIPGMRFDIRAAPGITFSIFLGDRCWMGFLDA